VTPAPGGFGHRCSNGHKYEDQKELRDELARVKPAAIKGTAPRIILPGQTKLEVIVRDSVRSQLAAKYGDRLEATVANVLAALCEDCQIFAGGDLKMLREGLGEAKGNAFELAARAKQMGSDTAAYASRVAAPEASAATDGPGTFHVKLSAEHTKQIQELARGRNMRADEVIAKGIAWNLDSNNF
jgi:hypothetical protein